MDEYAPMTPVTWEAPRHEVEHHDHAIVLFEREADLIPPLSAFVEDGLQKRDLIVFIHSFPSDADAWAFMHAAREDAPKLRADQVILISLYRDAFEGGETRIDHERVAEQVAQLTQTAMERGLSGVRIFVDASRRYFAQARVEEWFAFESWLGRRLQANAGLVCAYHASDLKSADIFEKALETHAYRFSPSKA